VKRPLLGLIVAPLGAPGSRLKVNTSPESGSDATAVKASSVASLIVWFATNASTGRLLLLAMKLAARGVGEDSR
jgi:hypothetical protein